MSSAISHPDDDRLSDLIDGFGTGEDIAHVATCDQCSARLREWRGVLGEIARVPAASPETRDAAVALALSHATTDLSSGQDSQIVDLSERRARRGRRLIGSVAAAAALVVGVSAALLTGSGGNPNHHPTVASPRSGSTTPSAAAAGGTASAGSGAGLSGSYLGNIDNAAQLVSELRSLPAAPFPAGPAGGSAGSAQSSTGSSGITPSGISSSGGRSCAPPPVSGAALRDTLALSWKGTPATVFVYSGPHGYTAYVESDSGCSLLVTVSF